MSDPKRIFNTIELVSIFFLLLIAIIIITAILYYNRRRGHKIDLANFQNTLLKTQLEVQEQTFINISRELHDNVTQVLSFVKLNLAMNTDRCEPEARDKIDQSRELISQAINDLRNLSKSMSYEHIAAIGLVKTLEIEVKRINNSKMINIDLAVAGEEFSLGEQRELILFRIFQEALNNTLKYAGAQHFKIHLQYSNQLVTLLLQDDGGGFAVKDAEIKGGLGLRNMKSRAALIGADLQITSQPGEGSRILIKLNPVEQLKYPDGNDPDRAR